MEEEAEKQYEAQTGEQQTEKETQTEKEKQEVKKLKDLLLKYPELKYSVTNVLLSEMIKRGSVTKDDIDQVRQMVGEQKSYTLKTCDFLKKSEVSTPYKFTKIEKLEDYENLIPANPIITYFK